MHNNTPTNEVENVLINATLPKCKYCGVYSTRPEYHVCSELSLLQAMQNKDTARIESWNKAAEAGEIVRIM
jgi:hypothetical protein